MTLSRSWFGILLLSPALLAQAPVRYDSGTISGLPARNIGSAEMSGRIAAVTGVNDGGRLTIFTASASGGVWKSINGGTTFKSVFDQPDVQSIGAVAIDPSNPKIVWTGTGESWVRNSVSIGDGIYKSTDGGENWKNVGLKDSEHIAKILIDPKDGNIVYACATGHLWDDNEERGVYKTTDGGKSWSKVLAGANGSTGCAMLAMSGPEPKTIYASMWDFRRQGLDLPLRRPRQRPVQIHRRRRPLDRVHRRQRQRPARKSRTAASPWQSRPRSRRWYTRPSNRRTARSSAPTTAARTGQRLDASQFMVWRPFYFANLIVDPKDENKVFKVDGSLLLSVNGGKSFSSVGQRARRLPRCLDRPGEPQHRLHRRRRRPVAQPGRRHALGTPAESAGLAVLSRQRR